MNICASVAEQRDEVRRIRLAPALPCGIGQCGRPATQALVEDDRERPALWSLLPICDDCARSMTLERQRRQTNDVATLPSVAPRHRAR